MAELAKLGELGELGQLAELVSDHPPIAAHAELLILQGSPFCNADCTYCYLPNRNDRRRMPMSIVSAAVRWLVENDLAGDGFTVVWHAGEPLVLTRDWYEEAFARVSESAPGLAVRHAIQTNATLLDAVWARFLRQHDVSVGVSLDGPAHIHDAARRTRAGGGTHAAAMEGVARLREAGVPFHAIAVVGAAALSDPDGFISFFEALDATELGVNIEETEGVHNASSLTDDHAAALRSFLTRLVAHSAVHGRPRLREVRRLLGLLRSDAFGLGLRTQENVAFCIVTVDVGGGLHTYSPELAGAAVAGWDGQPLGNVAQNDLASILASSRFQRLAAAVERGVDGCRTTCAYFPICGGGAPANKIGETGRFDATETRHCVRSIQTMSEVVLSRLEHDLAAAPTMVHDGSAAVPPALLHLPSNRHSPRA